MVTYQTFTDEVNMYLGKLMNESTLLGGQLGHFHNMFEKHTPLKCVAFFFEFIFWFSQKLILSNIIYFYNK